jgi:ribose/xylose/arabinose/galactoside ABC-type transport system permease subunit
VAIFGGWGTVAGIALGTLLLLVIENGLAFANVDTLWVQAVYGVVIVAAVAVDALLARRVSSQSGSRP